MFLVYISIPGRNLYKFIIPPKYLNQHYQPREEPLKFSGKAFLLTPNNSAKHKAPVKKKLRH